MNIIKRFFITFFSIFPVKNAIMFESAPDFSDSSYPVYKEMIKRGMNKNYQLIWVLYDKHKYLQRLNNVKYIYANKESLFNKIRLYYYKLNSKILISCNRKLCTYRKGQHSFYIMHGTTIKDRATTRDKFENIDYVIAASKDVIPLCAFTLDCEEKIIYGLGLPRNDVLGHFKGDLSKVFHKTYDKIIVWYPTFRQHKTGFSITGSKNAIPIIYNRDNAVKINDYLKHNNMLIVIKPHFAQDISKILEFNLSNIIFIDDKFYNKNRISSYKFLSSCDALLSDYSSVYYDYTLCNKPIGLVWEDINEYKKNPGLIDNYEEYTKGAEKIYNIDQFISFLENVHTGNDIMAKERNEIMKWANISDNGSNTKRVVDFIIRKSMD